MAGIIPSRQIADASVLRSAHDVRTYIWRAKIGDHYLGSLRNHAGNVFRGLVLHTCLHQRVIIFAQKGPDNRSVARDRAYLAILPEARSREQGCNDSREHLLRLQRQLAGYKLLVVDELGYVPLSPTGAELLFEVFSQRYERGSIIVTSNLPFDEWTGVFASERLTGALLDRLTHHVHILELNGDSFRLMHSKRRISDDQPPTVPG